MRAMGQKFTRKIFTAVKQGLSFRGNTAPQSQLLILPAARQNMFPHCCSAHHFQGDQYINIFSDHAHVVEFTVPHMIFQPVKHQPRVQSG